MKDPDFIVLYVGNGCNECGVCEKLYPDFKGKYNGEIKIAAWAYSRDDIRRKILDIVHCCPSGAIILK